MTHCNPRRAIFRYTVLFVFAALILQIIGCWPFPPTNYDPSNLTSGDYKIKIQCDALDRPGVYMLKNEVSFWKSNTLCDQNAFRDSCDAIYTKDIDIPFINCAKHIVCADDTVLQYGIRRDCNEQLKENFDQFCMDNNVQDGSYPYIYLLNTDCYWENYYAGAQPWSFPDIPDEFQNFTFGYTATLPPDQRTDCEYWTKFPYSVVFGGTINKYCAELNDYIQTHRPGWKQINQTLFLTRSVCHELCHQVYVMEHKCDSHTSYNCCMKSHYNGADFLYAIENDMPNTYARERIARHETLCICEQCRNTNNVECTIWNFYRTY